MAEAILPIAEPETVPGLTQAPVDSGLLGRLPYSEVTANLRHMRNFAEEDHYQSQAELGPQHQRLDHEGQISNDIFNIPGDRTSERLEILASAARIGNRSGEYVVPLAFNWHVFCERAITPLMEAVDQCKEEKEADSKAIQELENLIKDLKEGTV
jgi:hypothetical protein